MNTLVTFISQEGILKQIINLTLYMKLPVGPYCAMRARSSFIILFCFSLPFGFAKVKNDKVCLISET